MRNPDRHAEGERGGSVGGPASCPQSGPPATRKPIGRVRNPDHPRYPEHRERGGSVGGPASGPQRGPPATRKPNGERNKLNVPWRVVEPRRDVPQPKRDYPEHRGQMYPTGLAKNHPAFQTLQQYATKGCPVKMGRHWTMEEIHAAVERGNHVSARSPEAIAAYQDEISEKIKKGHARVVLWDDIKHNPPQQLKVSPLAMVPHKSRLFRAILDLSFSLRLSTHQIQSVNELTQKQSLEGVLDQLGTVLPRIITALAQTADDEVVFFAKFDIKDGFWRLVCEEGAEYNFAYVMPQKEGEPTKLVIPTSLQMGWTESPPCFDTATETARDIADTYVEAKELRKHYLEEWTKLSQDYKDLPSGERSKHLAHCFEIFVDDFISVAIPQTKEDLNHLSRALLHSIHDLFPACESDPENDPISLKKLKKLEGA